MEQVDILSKLLYRKDLKSSSEVEKAEIENVKITYFVNFRQVNHEAEKYENCYNSTLSI